MECTYEIVDAQRKAEIVETFGSWVETYGCVHMETNSITYAAIHQKQVIGFVSVYTKQEEAPYAWLRDGYIDCIEVLPPYRRQHVAAGLLARSEEWARKQGLYQLRAWSSDDKTEAIAMWQRLGYGLCPALMRGQSLDSAFTDKNIPGIYVVKVL